MASLIPILLIFTSDLLLALIIKCSVDTDSLLSVGLRSLPDLLMVMVPDPVRMRTRAVLVFLRPVAINSLFVAFALMLFVKY